MCFAFCPVFLPFLDQENEYGNNLYDLVATNDCPIDQHCAEKQLLSLVIGRLRELDAEADKMLMIWVQEGVILITTKKGTTGTSYKSTIDFDMMVGVQNAAKTYDMLDAEGFIKYKNMAYEASSKPLLDDFATPKKIETILSFLDKNGGRAGTNWWNDNMLTCNLIS